MTDTKAIVPETLTTEQCRAITQEYKEKLFDHLSKTQALSVLVLEDDVADITLIKIYLEQHKYIEFNVIGYLTLSSILEFLEDNNQDIDVILMDVKITDSWGANTVLALLKYNIPIVAHTNQKDWGVSKAVLDSGACHSLLKGAYTPELLASTLYASYTCYNRTKDKISELQKENDKLKSEP